MTRGADRRPSRTENTTRPIRVALFQRVVPEYRIGIFSLLARQPGVQLTIYSSGFSALPAGAVCRPSRNFRLGPLQVHVRPLLSALLHRHDVIICEGRASLITSLLLAIGGRWLGVKCIWWTSLYRDDGLVALRGGLPGWLTRLALRRAHAVLLYGNQAAEVARNAGIEGDRIFVAHNALDTDRLREIERHWRSQPDRLAAFLRDRGLQGRRIILFVGRLIAQKRADWLINVLDRLRRRTEKIGPRLVIIGEGPERERLTALAQARHLEEDVLMAGEIRDPEQSCPYFLSARVLALPGSGGLAINQAMSFGLPVVVAGGDGTERDAIVEGVNGSLVVPPDPEHFAQAIQRILAADDRRWDEMSAAARATVDRRINSRTMVGAMMQAIRSARNDRGRTEG